MPTNILGTKSNSGESGADALPDICISSVEYELMHAESNLQYHQHLSQHERRFALSDLASQLYSECIVH